MRLLLAAVTACILGLTGCRLDVAVDLVMGPDGAGEVVVSAVADAAAVEQAPGVGDDLRLDDAAAAGWAVDGPAATADGGLSLTLRHPVSSAAEATNLLASLGPPFADVRLERTAVDDTATVTMTGTLALPAGFDSFADSDLLRASGSTPFADRLAGASPAAVMDVTFRAELPGTIDETTGAVGDGAVEWVAPLDGSSVDVATRAVQRPASGPAWAGPLATGALVALIAWVLASAVFLVLVAMVRRRRARRALPYRA